MQSTKDSLLNDRGNRQRSRLKRFIVLATVLVSVLAFLSFPSQQTAPVAAQTTSLVSLIKDINTEPFGAPDQPNEGKTSPSIVYGILSNANHIYSDGNQVYIIAGAKTSHEDLWKSDGSAEGTIRIKEDDNFSEHSYLFQSINGRFLFSMDSRLFQTDGTPEGTSELAALPGITAGIINNQLIGLSEELRLWTSNGTPAGTKNLGIVPGSNLKRVKSLFSETSLNGKFYFLVHELTIIPPPNADLPDQPLEIKPVELWETDGTIAGTKVVATLSNKVRNVSKLVVLDNKIYFVVDCVDLNKQYYELWVSDGTAEGTQRIIASPIFDANLARYAAPAIDVLNGKLYFTGKDLEHGTELWVSDGTSAGTHLVRDINPGPEDGLVRLQTIHDTLLLTASDGVSGFELWASDGTAEGTYQVADIAPGPYSSTPVSFAPGSDFVAFSADDGVLGREPYKLAAPTAVTLHGSAASLAGAGPQSQVAVPLSYGNNGVTKAQSLTLSLELPSGLSYVSDTLGVAPTITGNLIEWHLPDASYLSKRSASVVLATPDQPYGTRFPLTFTLKADGVTPLTFQSEVMIAHQVYLPIVR